MLRLILVRHGQTIWNAQNRYQGQSDIPLSALGLAQAEAVAGRLAGEQIDAIYASDLQRAWGTAAAIAGQHDLAVQADPRLREMAFGEWEGMTFEEIEATYPDHLAAWMDESSELAAPAGETRDQLAERVELILSEIVERHSEQTVVLVAHGGTLLMLLTLVLHMPRALRWRFRIGHATVSVVHLYDGAPVLDLLNDGCHLIGLDVAQQE